MKKILILFFALSSVLSACNKGESLDAGRQAEIDDKKIKDYITANALPAEQHASGLYYLITSPGSGNITYNSNTTVTVKYTGRFLGGSVFESNTITYPVGGFIAGWKIGVPLIQKGGKIRLLIPSALAYGPDGIGNIPPNAVLDFDIELLEATN